jgi:all-trans-retinol dehydrogenase (NAD+)
MIERKRGRIVAISSLAAKLSLPMSTIYSTTKASVKAFMHSLYEELCCFEQESIVRLTTVFPGFIATRKELTDMLNKLPKLMMTLTPEYVADEIVKGMLNNQTDITIPKSYGIMAWLSK